MLYTQLRSFHAVAAEGGFTAASKVLNVGQPTITSQVKALEDFYGGELFHRRGRRVSLTEAGQGLFSITQRMMAQQAEARDYLNALSGFHTGHLRVGAVGPYHVIEMLSAFNAQYPDLELTVTLGNSRDMLERLLAFEVDVAVLAQVEDDPRFLAIPYARSEVMAFLRKDHPLARRAPGGAVEFAELAAEVMVIREQGSSTRRALDQALEHAGMKLARKIEIGSREAVWKAVQSGLGVGVVSQAEFVPHPDLKTLHIADADMHMTEHVVCLAERRESRITRAFLAVVEELQNSRFATT